MDDDQVTAGHAADLDEIAGDLEAVEAALARLDDGTFGRCATCGAEIAADELARNPLMTACAEHGSGGGQDTPTVRHDTPARGQEAHAGAGDSERAVGVLAGDDPFALGSEHPEG